MDRLGHQKPRRSHYRATEPKWGFYLALWLRYSHLRNLLLTSRVMSRESYVRGIWESQKENGK